jgi:uncharacterized membrane protein YccC
MNRTTQLREAFKLALSMLLFYWLTLWMDWDYSKFGALAIVVTSLATTGASLNKGIMRVVGTGIGALAGFVLLSLFAQSSWGILLGVSAWLVAIAYFIQTTRQGDTWFNAGFVPVAIWSSSYMQLDSAFHIASSRFLETAAGVLVFSIVSALLWPRTSGPALLQQGRSLWDGLGQLFNHYRGQLSGEQEPAGVAELRTKLAGDYQQMLATLQAAYTDTPQVQSRKRAWELLRSDLRLYSGAQELWRESSDDCRQLGLPALLPSLEADLDRLQQRLQHGTELWQAAAGDSNAVTEPPTGLLLPLEITIDSKAAGQLSADQKAAVANFTRQLRSLDQSSLHLLQTLRVLAELDTMDTLAERILQPDPYRPSRWNPERLFTALFPAACWGIAWGVWILIDPPGGPAIPMIAAALSLSAVMAPINLTGLLIVLLLSMFITVAPVYMFLMPTLDSGAALLGLVFTYTFVFALLGGKSPVLKIGPLMMFVMVVNITNEQAYSFMAMVTFSLVLLLGVSIVVLVDRLLSPMHPEKILLRGVRRFLTGCARVTGDIGLSMDRQPRRARHLRRRVFESRIVPFSARLNKLEQQLDYHLFPDNPPEKVSRLVDSLQSLRWRLQNLETTYDKAAEESPELLRTIAPLNAAWRQHVRETLNRWAKLQPVTDSEAAKEAAYGTRLARQLEQLHASSQLDALDDTALQHLYTVMGSTQSLLESVRMLGDNMRQINWQQWSTERF